MERSTQTLKDGFADVVVVLTRHPAHMDRHARIGGKGFQEFVHIFGGEATQRFPAEV